MRGSVILVGNWGPVGRALVVAGLVLWGAGWVGTGGECRAELVFTELMVDPASTPEGSWEYVEVYNSGLSAVDLAGFVLDDDDGDPIGGANIAAGLVPPGGSAVLVSSSTSLAQLQLGWGTPINWVPVTSWPSMNNSGDRIGLWSSLSSYSGRDFANVVEEVDFVGTAPWPSADGASSIYLKSLLADNSLGTNWALSTVGTAEAYSSGPLGDNLASNIGSPGRLVPEPDGIGLAGVGLMVLVARLRRRRLNAAG